MPNARDVFPIIMPSSRLTPILPLGGYEYKVCTLGHVQARLLNPNLLLRLDLSKPFVFVTNSVRGSTGSGRDSTRLQDPARPSRIRREQSLNFIFPFFNDVIPFFTLRSPRQAQKIACINRTRLAKKWQESVSEDFLRPGAIARKSNYDSNSGIQAPNKYRRAPV